MRVRLRPMTEAEYDGFARSRRRDYAAQIAAGGDVSPADAREKADHDLASILPRGRATDGHLFLRAEDEAGEPVGHLWLALCGPGGARASAWVYDVWVERALRGRGFGRAIMEAAEREARRHGLGRIGLNVFGYNAAAIGLYRSLGYHVSAMQMTKPIAAAAAGGDELGE